MKAIHKYVFAARFDQETRLQMPAGAKPLHVHEQYGTLCLWALVDPEEPVTQERRFVVYGTGHPVSAVPQAYVGTVHLNGGSLVFHVFELVTGYPQPRTLPC